MSNFKVLEKLPSNLVKHPLGVTWRKALVSLPRAVPDAVLRFTSSEGPFPIVIKLQSRDESRQIPLYVFVPPSITFTAAESDSTKVSQLRKCPVLVDFHGGGFVLGSCQEQAPFCAKMSRDLNCVAISVDYRLGPYAQFPAAYHDAEDVVKAIVHPFATGYHELRNAINSSLSRSSEPRVELDTTRLAFSGFSSGGSLALNLVLSIASQPGQIELDTDWPSPLEKTHIHPIPLLLYYPAVDTRLLPHERPLPPGMSAAPKGFWASLNLEGELMPTYLPKHLTTHPRASPGLVRIPTTTTSTDTANTTPTPTPVPASLTPSQTSDQTSTLGSGTLHPLAKFLVVLPELDTLSASNEAWVSKTIQERGHKDIKIERVPDMLHGWTQFPDGMLDSDARTKKAKVFERGVDFLREIWG